ncbi:MAG: hypothetical protein P8M73_08960 [Luminiphilus sp.]|nr:hypothetical protein [Luminiphilus sp.]
MVLVCLTLVAPLALADGHGGLTLEKRQPDAKMTVTSAKIGEEVSVITAEGDMGEYGGVCVTYNLAYDVTRTAGQVYGQGRGFTQDGFASGKFTGYWQMADGGWREHDGECGATLRRHAESGHHYFYVAYQRVGG